MSDIETLRHSASHVLAAAAKKLFPDAKLGMGPAVADGFYYDFGKKEPFTPEDISKIEKAMQHIVKQNMKFEKIEVDFKEAKKMLAKEPYKLELLEELKSKGEKITFYKSGGFIDLCKGPHVASTGKIGALKLTKMSSAYWKGDEARDSMQRIYGVAFEAKKELDEYLKLIEEAGKRDHRKIGTELDLFSTQDASGAGLVLWHPKGALIRQIIEDFWKAEHRKRGYQYIYTPHIANLNLWKKSGHWEFYRANMYSTIKIDDVEYELKPMSCPLHVLIYKTAKRSYRELPIRWNELGTVYRYERAGVLHGLTRVRGFTQDDAHIFCTPEQLESELVGVIELGKFMLETFGFKEYNAYLSTKPEKAIGTDEIWTLATAALEHALKKTGVKYTIDPGEGVFYGPKIDIKLKDALGREWQCSTIQVDFNFPEKFDINYVGSDNTEHRVVMVHRALLGSIERFIGVLIEHYAGRFPLWLSPVQVKVVTVNDRNAEFAREIVAKLSSEGLRVELDDASETIAKKVRNAQLERANYIVTIGDKEENTKTLAVRRAFAGKVQETADAGREQATEGTREGKVEFGVAVDAFVKSLKDEIARKA